LEKERGVHLMEKFSVEYTAGEASALLQLIDLAVKSGGMQVAEAAVVLSNKIREAAKAAEQARENSNGENPLRPNGPVREQNLSVRPGDQERPGVS
jgi:hypothetical protein